MSAEVSVSQPVFKKNINLANDCERSKRLNETERSRNETNDYSFFSHSTDQWSNIFVSGATLCNLLINFLDSW